MDTEPDSRHIVRLLAESSRRKVVAALVLHDEPLSASSIAEAAATSVRETVDALDRLVKGGLVVGLGDEFRLADGVFEAAARAEAPDAAPSDHADQPDDIARVLDVAFNDGKLVQWPAKRTKRLIVLDHLAQQFDIGTRYTEAEVNERLRVFDDDVATMRRYLIDEQFLDRDHGDYWRCGGTF